MPRERKKAEKIQFKQRPAPEQRPVPPGLVRFRVPGDAPEDAARLADRALQRVEDVMEERVASSAMPGVMAACKLLREEICGSVPKDINVKGKLSWQQLVAGSMEDEQE